MGLFMTGRLSSIFAANAGCKGFSGGFDVRVIERPHFYGAGFAPDIALGGTKTRRTTGPVQRNASAICGKPPFDIAHGQQYNLFYDGS